jgi:hypothetical protein
MTIASAVAVIVRAMLPPIHRWRDVPDGLHDAGDPGP